MRTPRFVAVVLAAAVALTSLDFAPASAASGKSQTQASQTSTIDLSARRRWHGGNAAALAAVLGVFGTIATLAATRRYRERYYYYEDAPYAYYGGPYAYSQPYVYSQPYRFHRWHHHHHHH